MAVASLTLTDFRNFSSATMMPLLKGFNVICGDNGSGKTSLLEAIYYLSLGRSFRSNAASSIIRHNKNYLSIFAQINSISTEQYLPVGLERHLDGEMKIRISGNDVNTVTELASLVPIQLIHSECHELLQGGPACRRKYLDWGAFYWQEHFIRIWRRFERALKQRNAGLRGQLARNELTAWTEEVIETGGLLDQIRREYTARLLPFIHENVRDLLNLTGLDIVYQPGWHAELDYREAMQQSYYRDQQCGFTSQGPHRADVSITLNEKPIKDILSRGQQKLFVCAMILAQSALLHDYTLKKSIYLVDDLPSELDQYSRHHVVALLNKQDAQVFVTAIEPEAISDALTGAMPIKMFHVKQCGVTEV